MRGTADYMQNSQLEEMMGEPTNCINKGSVKCAQMALGNSVGRAWLSAYLDISCEDKNRLRNCGEQ